MCTTNDSVSMKESLGDILSEEMRKDPDIVLVGADLMGANGTWPLHEEFGERVINVGIAEANMVGIAAGLAAAGKTPICDTFAAFMGRRDYDQIFISVCYAGLNVKFIGSDPGVSAEMNGGTHMAFEDIALMRTIPTMSIVEPCDATQLIKAIPTILAHEGPVYIRLFRKTASRIYDENYEFTLGKADMLRDGSDVTIIAYGLTVASALCASDILAEKGISARIINMHTIKPLDTDMVINSARKTGAIITAENANYLNGLGSAVAEIIAEHDLNVPFSRIGVRDEFGEVGTINYLSQRFHIAPEDIVAEAISVIKRKHGGSQK